MNQQAMRDFARIFGADYGALFGVQHADPGAQELLNRGVRWPGCESEAPAPTGIALGLLELAARARGWRPPQ